MRVVDTSAWIEWLAGSTVGKHVSDELPPRSRHVVPTIVLFELAVWAGRETSHAEMKAILADETKSVVVPIDTVIALRAAQIRRAHRLATADAIVYATALHRNADLLTCDAHFGDLPHVVYIPKMPP